MSNVPGKKKSVGAFTLTELLVTIATIVILAALLFPVAKRVIESGQRATCLGNMRALGQGMLSYAADHNGIIPGWGWAYNDPPYASPADRANPPGVSPRQPGTGDVRCGLLMLGGYINSEKVFQCPAKRKLSGRPYGYPGLTYALNGTPGYSLSKSLGRDIAVDTNLDFPITALKTPSSKTVMLVEENGTNANAYDNDIVLFDYNPPSGQDSLGTSFHSNRGNVVFFDGSARSMTTEEWWQDAWTTLPKATEFYGGITYRFWGFNLP